MATGNALKGARLEFVLLPFDEEWDREITSFDKKKKHNTKKTVKETGGYMLYTPFGQCYRLTKAQAQKKGLVDREPEIINLEKVTDTTSPVGRFKHARTMEARQKAYRDMQEQVIRCCKNRDALVKFMNEGDYDAASAA